jgi:hypothetical protein
MFIILSITSLGLLYYLYNKQNSNVIFSILKCYSAIENKYNNIYNSLYHSDNKYLLEEIKDYNDKETHFYILNFQIKENNIYQIINFEENNNDLPDFLTLFKNNKLNDYINYQSPIISCFMITNNEEIDITSIINKFINYNGIIQLSNEPKIKELWLNLLLKYNNIKLDHDEIKNNTIKWKIILENIDMYENDELLINIDNGGLTILKQGKQEQK